MSTVIPDITETRVTGLPGRTPREEIEAPVVGDRKREVVLFIDGSRSNLEYADEEGTITKADLLRQAVPILVKAIAGDDSEAAKEKGTGKGGARTWVFNEPGRIAFKSGEDESEDYRDLGDMSEENVIEKMASIDFNGRTYIKPVLDAAEYAYLAEFPKAADRANRALEIVVLTDGKLNDPDEFEAWLDSAGPDKVMAVGVIGCGDGHNQAVEHYQKHQSPFLKVLDLNGVASAAEVAHDVRKLAGTAAS